MLLCQIPTLTSLSCYPSSVHGTSSTLDRNQLCFLTDDLFILFPFEPQSIPADSILPAACALCGRVSACRDRPASWHCTSPRILYIGLPPIHHFEARLIVLTRTVTPASP
ncbi:hypothetical protein P152DRAFT_5954 [Eremomyces bilateralis CBS 781.70]|uniref:Uncharacterized protein n=1 Tax=Eremomyces bilateralis CBS 781.70 TaxID=1392243 RepID=A0A6G1GFY7_9PEZI|nr:uncharacterized protein P152DRAFT_5954 [Eremomyces bilateralis CBS 781.70]KAF1817007.1 hypothetical protein P152DRAFT_5954 [Eremomyces bilateralis CBS 781.70]